MTLKPYRGPGACSLVTHTLLEASGEPFEPTLVKLHDSGTIGILRFVARPSMPTLPIQPRAALNTRLRLAAALLCLASAGSVSAQQPKPAEALKSATQLADQIKAATGANQAAAAAAPQKKLPSGDPCGVLPLVDVQKVFPGAKAGEHSRRLEEYGSTECSWKGPDGQVLLAVQESFGSGSAMDDVQGMAQGFTDPLNRQAARNVRFETLPGLSVESAAFVEQADEKRGILSDGAMLSLRKGEHTIWIMSGDLPRRDRAAALKAFEALGRVAAKRL